MEPKNIPINNRDSFEQFVKQNKDDIKKKAPWIGLLSNQTQWYEFQDKVECAALISPLIDRVGWYMGPANLSGAQSVQKLQVPADQSQLTFTSKCEDMDGFLIEFFYDVYLQDNLFFDAQNPVNKKLLTEINKFVTSRGGVAWKLPELSKLLNHNLIVIRQKYDLNNLPAQKELSLEYLYGIMIAVYGNKILDTVPQIAILALVLPFANCNKECQQSELLNEEPLQQKEKKLHEKLKEMKNWEKLQINENMSIQEMIAVFKNAFDNKTVGKSTRNKLKKLLKNLTNEEKKTTIAYKNIAFNIRKGIKNLSKRNQVDYRQFDNLEIKFFNALRSCLNDLPTDIGVYNNGTLRNPRLHILYPFLMSLNPTLDVQEDQVLVEQQEELFQVAQLIQRARKFGYFTSDWQNNIAKQWNNLRNQQVRSIRKIIKQNNGDQQSVLQKVLVPPPMPYDLALDLNPQAHPFAFTYGRQMGYCLEMKESFNFFNGEQQNEMLAKYFVEIVRNPPAKLGYIKELTQMVDNNNYEDVKKKISEIQEILVSKKAELQNTALYGKMKEYIEKRYNQLPEFLRKKIDLNKAEISSVMTLFDLVFENYHPEDLYLDNVQLQLPSYNKTSKHDPNEEAPEGYGGLINKKGSLQSYFFWGPINYGGAVGKQ